METVPGYVAADVIANINANMSNLIIWGTLANLLAYVQVIYGAWIGYRHKSHAVPLGALTMWFAHDSYYVLNYDYWINTINHPFFVGNLVAMSIFVCFELLLMWQIVTYSREEVGFGKSKLMAWVSLIAVQVGVYVMFLWFRSMMGDPLYQEAFVISVVFANLFNIPMLLRRGSRKGQSLIIAAAIAVQTGPVAFFLVNPNLGAYFNTPIWQAAGAANTVLAFVYLYMLWKAPPYSHEQGLAEYAARSAEK